MRVPRASVRESISHIEGSPHAIECAKRIVELLEREKFPVPFVFGTEIGGIQFEWKADDRELNLEVLPEGDRVAFLMITGGTPTREGEITGNLDREICSLFAWMVSR